MCQVRLSLANGWSSCVELLGDLFVELHAVIGFLAGIWGTKLSGAMGCCVDFSQGGDFTRGNGTGGARPFQTRPTTQTLPCKIRVRHAISVRCESYREVCVCVCVCHGGNEQVRASTARSSRTSGTRDTSSTPSRGCSPWRTPVSAHCIAVLHGGP